MIKKMLVIPHFWVLAVMLSIQVCNAAEITKERGVNGLPDVIRIAGQFNLGDQDKFQAIALTSKKAIVYLDSPGGRVKAATEIGIMIRMKGFETAVDLSLIHISEPTRPY